MVHGNIARGQPLLAQVACKPAGALKVLAACRKHIKGMPSSCSGLDDQKLLDFLAHHVVPLLSLRDAQALGQTCSSLRNLITRVLPATTWTSLARHTMLSSHPILAADSAHMYAQLSQLADFHAAVRSDTPVRRAKASILFFRHSSDTPAYFSHSADIFLCQQEEAIRLYSLDFPSEHGHDRGVCTAHTSLVFSQPTLERQDGARWDDCSFTWSPDDSWVAIWYKVKDLCDPQSQTAERLGPRNKRHGPDGQFDVVYTFDIATREVHEVTYRKEVERLLAPSISSDSQLLILQWTSQVFGTHIIDIYSQANQQLMGRVRDEGHNGGIGDVHLAVERLKPSPSSQCFALAHAADVHIYSMDGSLKAVLNPGHPPPEHSQRQQVSWSPDGSLIAYWQPGRASTALSIFETVQWTLVHGPLLVEFESRLERAGGMLWGPGGLMPIIRTRYRSGCCILSKLSHLMVAFEWSSSLGSLSSTAVAKVRMGDCMPVASADGTFIAPLDTDRLNIFVLDVHSGACVFLDTIYRGPCPLATSAGSFKLAWAGRRLLVKHNGGSAPLELLTIFEF